MENKYPNAKHNGNNNTNDIDVWNVVCFFSIFVHVVRLYIESAETEMEKVREGRAKHGTNERTNERVIKGITNQKAKGNKKIKYTPNRINSTTDETKKRCSTANMAVVYIAIGHWKPLNTQANERFMTKKNTHTHTNQQERNNNRVSTDD